MPIFHNRSLRDFIRTSYGPADVDRLHGFLEKNGVFRFPVLATGLFPAADVVDGDKDYTGYGNVWVRDNIHLAHAHYFVGDIPAAVRNVVALATYFRKFSRRFDEVVLGESDPNEPMNRPHVRFNGSDLEENEEKWSHAQNDALGYFLWFYCRLAREGHLVPEVVDWELLDRFPKYFERIRFWEDEDSGHWEETRKVCASSIGAVTAGLGELKLLLDDFGDALMAGHDVKALEARGRDAMNAILPWECIQDAPEKRRRYDGALLFLVFPLDIVSPDHADDILHDVVEHLSGDYGIRRYLGDSYWCADYKTKISEEIRTSDFSDDLSGRDSLLKEGEEAQWCIFDSILSVVYGRRFQASGNSEDLARQTHFLNRSLGQITGSDCRFGEFLCPESYYLEDGEYVPNDVTPLLWTQANLMVAMEQMKKSTGV